MKQKQNEILGWIHPELFNLKWLIPYKAQADPSSVLINTLSLLLNRKQDEQKYCWGGEGKRQQLFTVSCCALFVKFVEVALIIKVDENAFFLKKKSYLG